MFPVDSVLNMHAFPITGSDPLNAANGAQTWHGQSANHWLVPPCTGNWTQHEPLGFAAGQANLYQYVGNDPMTATDPSGLQAQPFFGRCVEVKTTADDVWVGKSGVCAIPIRLSVLPKAGPLGGWLFLQTNIYREVTGGSKKVAERRCLAFRIAPGQTQPAPSSIQLNNAQLRALGLLNASNKQNVQLSQRPNLTATFWFVEGALGANSKATAATYHVQYEAIYIDGLTAAALPKGAKGFTRKAGVVGTSADFYQTDPATGTKVINQLQNKANVKSTDWMQFSLEFTWEPDKPTTVVNILDKWNKYPK